MKYYNENLGHEGRTGEGAVSTADSTDTAKQEAALKGLEEFQAKMKAVNVYYSEHGTLDGCPQLSSEETEKLKAGMAQSWRARPKPYETFLLANNRDAIRQLKGRIAELSEKGEYVGWEFEGGEVKAERKSMLLQVFFSEKPDRDTCSAMRQAGFYWVLNEAGGAWQRPLNNSAIRAADQLKCIRPMFGYLPSELQKTARQGQIRACAVWESEDWANWHQMSAEERLAVSFQKLIRQRFPNSEADGPAESETTTEWVRMLLDDGKGAADQMILTIAGLTIGSEVSQEVEKQAGSLMASLAHYRDSCKARRVESKPKAVAGLAAGLPDNIAVQESAATLIKELGQYQGQEKQPVPQKKPRHKSTER